MSDEEILNTLLSCSPPRQPDWTAFLDRFSNLILKVIWQYERDYDEVMEKYLYVCRRLADKDLARLRRFRPSDPGGNERHAPMFTTWLAAVTQNLCIDAHRAKHGRRQLPRAVLRLPERDREIFRLYYWKGLSPEEIEQSVGDTRGESTGIAGAIDRIREVFTGGLPTNSDPVRIPLEENDPRLALTEESDLEEMLVWVERWMESLAPQERMIIRLRFWEDMSAPEIAGAMGISPVQRVYPLLQQALASLRASAARTYATRKQGKASV